MNRKTIVILLQENSSNRGEVTSFDQAQDAERFIEGLLETGFERQSIRVLAAQDLDLLITQKPVVSLLSTKMAPAVEMPVVEVSGEIQPISEEVPDGDLEPVQVEAMESHMERELVTVGASAGSDVSTDSEPYTRNGIRFSSAFASEY